MQDVDEKLIQMAAGAIDLAPKAEQPDPNKGIPIQLMLQFVSLGILSPRQAYYWFFQQVEPTGFDGPVPPFKGKRR